MTTERRKSISALAERFRDGDLGTTFWVPQDCVEDLAEAIAEVAKLVGPFDSHVYAELVVGRVEDTSDGLRFEVAIDGDFYCWQIDAA